jgi:hypothetical protein
VSGDPGGVAQLVEHLTGSYAVSVPSGTARYHLGSSGPISGPPRQPSVTPGPAPCQAFGLHRWLQSWSRPERDSSSHQARPGPVRPNGVVAVHSLFPTPGRPVSTVSLPVDPRPVGDQSVIREPPIPTSRRPPRRARGRVLRRAHRRGGTHPPSSAFELSGDCPAVATEDALRKVVRQVVPSHKSPTVPAVMQ